MGCAVRESFLASEKRTTISPIPDGARGVALLRDASGSLYERVIESNEVILNIDQSLLHHLDEMHCSDEFLARLHGYCSARLEARKLAQEQGRSVILGPGSTWHVI